MVLRGRSTVFRVSNIPDDEDALRALHEEEALFLEEELVNVLNAALSKTGDQLAAAFVDAVIQLNLLPEERSIIRTGIEIIPSCYPGSTRCALLRFFRAGERRAPTKDNSIPQFFMEDGKPEAKLAIDLNDVILHIDRHFFGLTQLYATEEEPVLADIIAITGLAGHAWGSWRECTTGQMWLRDFFRKDLPGYRTMTYGYNSSLKDHNMGTILDYGRGFLEEVRKVRTDVDKERPIILIGHSFGGLLIAQSLLKAESQRPNDILQATKAIIFFGTPHKGLVVEDMLKMVREDDQEHPTVELLNSINRNSVLLKDQLASFTNIVNSRKLKLFSFYEQNQTRRLEKNPVTDKYGRGGAMATAVETDSALLQLPDGMEVKIPVSADHSTMVKFESNKNITYDSVLSHIKSLHVGPINLEPVLCADGTIEWLAVKAPAKPPKKAPERLENSPGPEKRISFTRTLAKWRNS